MKKFTLTFVTILIAQSLYSQTKEQDLLNNLKILPTSNHDSIYYELYKITKSNDIFRAKHYAHLGLMLADSLKHYSVHAKSCGALGNVYKNLHQMDSALVYLRQAIHVSSAHQLNDLLMYYYNNMGGLSERLDWYDSALLYYTRSYDMAVQLESYYHQAITQHNMGLVYNYLNDQPRAQFHLKNALEINNTHGVITGEELNTMLVNSASIYIDHGKYDEALGLLNIVSSNCKGGCSDYILSQLYYGLGYANLKNGALVEAREFYSSAIAPSRKADAQTLANALFELSSFEIDERNYAKAGEYLLEAEEIALKIEHRRLLQKIYSRLSTLYESILPERAFHYEKLYRQVRDSIFNETVANNVKEIELLAQRKESDNIIQEKDGIILSSRTTAALTGLICIFSFAIIFLVFRSLQSSKLRKQKLENEVIKRTFEAQEVNREMHWKQLEFDHILSSAQQYMKLPLNSIRELITVTQVVNINEQQWRECIDKLSALSRDCELVSKLLTELMYNARDGAIIPAEIKISNLLDDLYATFKGLENFPVVSITVDNSVTEEIKTDKELLINLIVNSIKYFRAEKEVNVDIFFIQSNGSTSINIANGANEEVLPAFQENIFHLFLAQLTAFKLKGHILLAEQNKRTTLRIIVPNELKLTGSKLFIASLNKTVYG